MIIKAFVVMVAATIPVGVALSFFTNNAAWLILAAFGIAFFLAGG